MKKTSPQLIEDIIRLQEQVKTLKENDLVHIVKQVENLDTKVDKVDGKIDTAHEKIDNLSLKLARYGGGIAVIAIIVPIVVQILFGYFNLK